MNELQTNQHKFWLLLEKIFVAVAFIHYSGGPLYLFLTNGVSEGDDGDVLPTYPLVNGIFMVIYFITLCLLIIRWKKVGFVMHRTYLVWAIYPLAMLSYIWTDSQPVTGTRLIALSGTVFFSLYLASRYTIQEQLKIYGLIFGTIIIMCFFFAIFLPKYGIMGGFHQGAWRGIYNHKNVLGKIMLPSTLVFLILSMGTRQKRWILWSFLAASVVLLVLSKSSSPLLNIIVLLGLLSLLPALRLNYLLLVPAIIGILTMGAIVYFGLTNSAGQLASAVGKDLTLTGRTNFWPLMLDKIWEKPWLGYGYGAFWQGLDGPSAYVWNASEFKAPNGHNGFLDLCVQLGIVGLVLYLGAFIVCCQKALAYVRFRQTTDAFWPILLFVYVIFSNLTETSLVLQNSFLWIMELTTCLSLFVHQPLENQKQSLEERDLDLEAA